LVGAKKKNWENANRHENISSGWNNTYPGVGGKGKLMEKSLQGKKEDLVRSSSVRRRVWEGNQKKRATLEY